MKTKHSANLFALTLLIALFISSTGFSQRYRGYYAHYYYSKSYFSVHPYVSLHFGVYDYRYLDGYFYRPFGSYYRLVTPPFGIRIGALPFGYWNFYLGPNPYYYYNGTFYRPYAREYEVVSPPLGAIVNKLPRDSKVKVVNGQKYYEFNGTYYEEQLDKNNKVSYMVVGTHYVLNTNLESNKKESTQPQIGDTIDQLPANSKPVVINGEKLYSTADGLYYKEVTGGNKVHYELVGK